MTLPSSTAIPTNQTPPANTPAVPAASGGQSPAPVQPVQPTQPVTPAPQEQPVTPVPALDAGPIAQPAPDFRSLGQQEQPQGTPEAQWLRQQYAQALEKLATTQQQLEEFQLAGLDDGERQQEIMRRQMEQFQQQQQAWQYQQALGEWRTYYSQFKDYTSGNIDLNQVDDPIQMGHQVTTGMATQIAQQRQQIQQLQAQLQALQGANNGATPPPVTQGGSDAPTGKRTWRDMSTGEREQAYKKIRIGLASVNDFV